MGLGCSRVKLLLLLSTHHYCMQRYSCITKHFVIQKKVIQLPMTCAFQNPHADTYTFMKQALTDHDKETTTMFWLVSIITHMKINGWADCQPTIYTYCHVNWGHHIQNTCMCYKNITWWYISYVTRFVKGYLFHTKILTFCFYLWFSMSIATTLDNGCTEWKVMVVGMSIVWKMFLFANPVTFLHAIMRWAACKW